MLLPWEWVNRYTRRLITLWARRQSEKTANNKPSFTLHRSSTRMRLVFETLEPRLLLSADPLGITAGYAFDEGTGTTAADASGHGIVGTLTNGPGWSAGVYGSALNLDGVNDYVALGNSTALQMTGSMTVSAWIYSTSFPSDDAAVVSKRSGEIGFQLDTTVDKGPRTIGFKLTNSSGGQMLRYGATTLQLNTWYHIAGVYNAAAQTLDVYLNGQLDDGVLQGTVTASQQNSTLDVTIGRRAGATSYEFAGRIDDVRIADHALTQSQIQTDMATPLVAGTDFTAPSVQAINRVGSTPTNAGSVQWAVTFSESVTGVDAGDFALVTTGTIASAAITNVSGSGNSYTVTVGTGTGDGTLGLNLVDNDSILDLSANRLGGTGLGNGTFTGQSYTIDKAAPTGTLVINGGAAATNSRNVTLTLSATDALSSVTQMRFSNTGTSFSAAEAYATTKAWTLTTGAGTKTVYVQFKDAVGNWSTAAITDTIVLDTTAPTISARTATNITSSSATITWTTNEAATSQVNYGLTTSYGFTTTLDSTLVTAHSVTITGLASNTTYNYRVRSRDAAGNESVSANSTFVTAAGADTVAPTVQSINRVGPTPTNATSLSWTVLFSESVTGVNAADFALVATGGVAGASIGTVTGSGTTYTVTANTGTGSGTLGLNLVDDNSILDSATNPLGGAGGIANGNFTGQVYTIDKVAPSVTINQAAAQADPTNASPINFTVLFSETVTGFAANDISFAGSTVGGTLTAVVSGTGPTYNVAVSGMTGTGNVVASVSAGAATDAAGNASSLSTSTDNTVAYDAVAPSVTINQAAGQTDPTNTSPINFAVVFSEAVTGFAANDISFAGSTVGGTLTAVVSGTGPTYNVAVSGMTGTGNVVASVLAGAATDAAGNANLVSSSTDNTVAFTGIDVTAPTVTINQAVGQADPTGTSPINFTVVFSETVTGFAANDISFTGSTVGGALTAVVSGTGPTYTVGVTGMTGTGNVVASVSAGAATDAAGNANLVSSSTDNTVTFTNTQTAGLIAGYAFDEGTGTTASDASGHGFVGTLTGATWTTAGKYGNALVFNGTSALVTVPNAASLQLTTGMTLEAWVNPSVVTAAWRDVIYKGNDSYYLEATSTNASLPGAGGTFGASPLYGAAALAANTWTHLAVTYDRVTLRLYVNGVQVSSLAATGAIETSTDPLQIGGDSIYGQYFQGAIDEVRVYNRALSPTEIQADLATPVQASPNDPELPQVHIDAPLNGAQVNNIVTITADATDDVGVAGVQFFVDGVPTGLEDTADPYALTWDTRAMSNGAHTLTARARDVDGFTALSAPVMVNVSNTSYFQNEILATGFNLPTAIKFLPDGRMLVAELTGTIKVLPPPYTSANPTPFLQLDLNIPGYDGLQQGIFDIALDPDFTANHYYYVFYTNDTPNRDRLSRFTANAALDGTVAGSEVILYEDPQTPNTEHHGGAINFGNDGKIYFTTGDHFLGTPAQDLTSPRGKVLRINPDGTVPTDNPFYDGAGPNYDAVWAYGLRNPYRAYYDAPTGRLFIGDVGGNIASTAIEELNVGVRGANYGWPNVEGTSSNPAYTNPIFAYPHNGRDAAITGGFVYHGTQFPSSYQGSYFFADYAQNWIRRLTFDANGTVTGVFNFEPADGSVDGPYGDIVYLTEGPEGALYYVDLGYSDVSGTFGVSKIRRIQYIQSDLPPVVAASATPAEGPVPLTVNFSSAGSSDPEGMTAYLFVEFRRRSRNFHRG